MDSKINVKLEASPLYGIPLSEESVFSADFLIKIKNECNTSGNGLQTDDKANVKLKANVPDINLQKDIQCFSANVETDCKNNSTTNNNNFEIGMQISIKEEPVASDAEIVSEATSRNDTFFSLNHVLKIKEDTDSDIERTKIEIDYQSEAPSVPSIYQANESEDSNLEMNEAAGVVATSESPRLTSGAAYHNASSLTFTGLVAYDFETMCAKNPNKKSSKGQNNSFKSNQMCDSDNCEPEQKRFDKSILVNKCEICHKGFKSEGVLRRHSLCHLTIKPYKCDICNKCFIRKSRLATHTSLHSGIKPYKCNSCEKSFTEKSNLKRHSLFHSDTKPYKCDSCDMCFREKSTLERHILNHSGIKPYKCDSCEKCFTEKSTLNRHMLFHSGAKPYKCNSCEKSFTRKSRLETHTSLHLGIKPYKCNSCEKSFTEKSTLKRHTLFHLGTKPFKCDSCNKCFLDKANLNRHSVIHLGIKPYKCESCDKCFTLKSHLKTHIASFRH